MNQRCSDPCPGTCGLNTNCDVINHSPICSCRERYTGDPFSRCYPIPRKPSGSSSSRFFCKEAIVVIAPQTAVTVPVRTNPCLPSPCGLYSECRDLGDSPSCSCSLGYMGSPPSCRPECVINSECPYNKACIGQKCNDPCVGSCGSNAQCTIFNHTPICTCPEGFTGDPFSNCYPKPARKRFLSPHRFPLLTKVPIISSGTTGEVRSLQPFALWR